jgi:hypothetical protein
MSYGCGPAGSRSDFQGISLKRMFETRNSLKPRSRCEWHSRLARILGRIAAWSGRPARRPRHRVHRAVRSLLFISIISLPLRHQISYTNKYIQPSGILISLAYKLFLQLYSLYQVLAFLTIVHAQ